MQLRLGKAAAPPWQLCGMQKNGLAVLFKLVTCACSVWQHDGCSQQTFTSMSTADMLHVKHQTCRTCLATALALFKCSMLVWHCVAQQDSCHSQEPLSSAKQQASSKSTCSSCRSLLPRQNARSKRLAKIWLQVSIVTALKDSRLLYPVDGRIVKLTS